MNRYSIKKSFLFLAIFFIVLFSSYLGITLFQLKETTVTALEQKSLNKALLVALQIIRENDRVAYKYNRYTDEMRRSLQKAQEYFLKNGRLALLEPLKKQLNTENGVLNYDIYLINKDFIIERSTFKPDLGLDFHLLPEALRTIIKVYNESGLIDISQPRSEIISQKYKSYILQRAKNSDYMIQLSLTIDDKISLQKFILDIQKKEPNLIKSTIFKVFPDREIGKNIEYAWCHEFTIGKKSKLFENDSIYKNYMEFFGEENNLSSQEIQVKLKDFLRNNSYIDSYKVEGSKYIHKILIPFVSYVTIEDGAYVLALEFDETALKDELNALENHFILSWLVLFIIVIIIIVLINKRLIQPILHLQSLMKEKKLVDIKMLLSTKDEISSMSLIYNQMLKDLKREITTNEELLAKFKNFAGNSIHQIRTPVSVIKIALEMIDAQNEEALTQIKSSLVSIEHLYDTLSYTLSKEEVIFTQERLNLSDILHQRIELFEVVAKANDKTIQLNFRPDIMVYMNKLELEFLIDNNLSNAIKYSTPYTTIEIFLNESDKEITLYFANHGKLIEDTKAIFQRYFRADSSRKGNGIGLHIVDSIAKKNNILISVTSINSINTFSYFFSKDVT